jgi:dipeptidyl aminopeptidase B
MSAKVVEADAGIHSLAMSVAVRHPLLLGYSLLIRFKLKPVTSWRLYGMFLPMFTYNANDVALLILSRTLDSIYTERYMNKPSLNPSGYINASISNVTGFHHVDYLLAHGSGDDNVHYANSAHLLDMLTRDRVRGFRFRMFTDSDHSMTKRGAHRELIEWMVEFLIEKWGKGGRRRTW